LRFSAPATFWTSLRNQLEAEGVGVTTTKADPPRPIIIEPVKERLAYDIAIPITKAEPGVHDIRKLSELNVALLKPVYEQEDLAEVYRVKLKLEFATTETEVSQVDIGAGELPPPRSCSGPSPTRSSTERSSQTASPNCIQPCVITLPNAASARWLTWRAKRFVLTCRGSKSKRALPNTSRAKSPS
jgi:hypothetical protein